MFPSIVMLYDAELFLETPAQICHSRLKASPDLA